jgi:hypothetical protein
MQGLEAAAEQLKTGDARDPSAVARNAAVVGGIGPQHLLPYTGRPSAIVQHDSAEAILKRLQQKHPGMFIEGTAEEVPLTEANNPVLRELERRREEG